MAATGVVTVAVTATATTAPGLPAFSAAKPSAGSWPPVRTKPAVMAESVREAKLSATSATGS